MTANEFRLYLTFVACFVAALGLVNMMRPHKRWLGAGAVSLSIGAMLYLGGFPTPAIAAVCAFAAFCMGRDVVLRQRSKA